MSMALQPSLVAVRVAAMESIRAVSSTIHGRDTPNSSMSLSFTCCHVVSFMPSTAACSLLPVKLLPAAFHWPSGFMQFP